MSASLVHECKLQRAINALVEALREEITQSSRVALPSDYRHAKRVELDELARLVKSAQGVSISVGQLRRYECGDVDNLDHRQVVLRMRAIASVLGVSYEDYRNAVQARKAVRK